MLLRTVSADVKVCESSSEDDNDIPSQYPCFEAFDLAIRSSNRILDMLSYVPVPHMKEGTKSSHLENSARDTVPTLCVTTHSDISPSELRHAQVNYTELDRFPCQTIPFTEDNPHDMCLAAVDRDPTGGARSATSSEASHEAAADHSLNKMLISAANERQAMASSWILDTVQVEPVVSSPAMSMGSPFGQGAPSPSSPNTKTKAGLEGFLSPQENDRTASALALFQEPCAALLVHAATIRDHNVDVAADNPMTHETAMDHDANSCEAKAVAAAIAAAAVKAVVEAVAAAEREKLMQRTAVAQRKLEVQIKEREARAAEKMLQHARRRVAVLRISHAWEQWHGSVARAQRLAAIVKIQACARALIAKKLTASMKEIAALRQIVRACPSAQMLTFSGMRLGRRYSSHANAAAHLSAVHEKWREATSSHRPFADDSGSVLLSEANWAAWTVVAIVGCCIPPCCEVVVLLRCWKA